MNITMKRNDVGNKFTYTLENEDGTPVNLTGCSIRFQMGDKNKIITDNIATIEDVVNGIVSYTFKDSDTLFNGNFIGEFVVKFSDTKELRYPRNSYIVINMQLNVDTEATDMAIDSIAKRQGEFSDKLNAIIANNSSLSEVIDARGIFITLNERLNDFDTNKTNKTYVDTELLKKSDKIYVDDELNKKADKTQPAWINAPLQNGWTGTLQYFKDTMGFVHIRGNLGTGTITQFTTVANLPIGYRPIGVYIPIVAVWANQTPYYPVGTFHVDINGDILVNSQNTLYANRSTASIAFEISYLSS